MAAIILTDSGCHVGRISNDDVIDCGVIQFSWKVNCICIVHYCVS